MKIIVDGKAYVQLNDIMYILNNLDEVSIPGSIFDVLFKNDKLPLICTDDNRYDFVKFTEEKAIEFFKNYEYSVDYLSFKDKSKEEIIQEGIAVAAEKNKLAKKYNEMSYEDKVNNQSILKECEMLEFKMLSIRDIVWMKQGKLKVELPEINIDTDRQQKGVKKIFNIFKKR